MKDCCEGYLVRHNKWLEIVKLIDPHSNKRRNISKRHNDYSYAALLWQDVKMDPDYVAKIYEKSPDLDTLKKLLGKLDELYAIDQELREENGRML